MKFGTREISNNWIILGVAILIGILIFVFLSIPSCQKPPVTPQQTINEVKVELEKQYQGQLKEKDTQIKDWKSRFDVSDSKYKLIAQKLIDLQKEKENARK